MWQKDFQDGNAEPTTTFEPPAEGDYLLPNPVYSGQLCSKRASNPGPFGKDHLFETCKAGCLGVHDCHFMSINKQGFCRCVCLCALASESG